MQIFHTENAKIVSNIIFRMTTTRDTTLIMTKLKWHKTPALTDKVKADFFLGQPNLVIRRSVEDSVVVDVLLRELQNRLEGEIDVLNGTFVFTQQ